VLWATRTGAVIFDSGGEGAEARSFIASRMGDGPVCVQAEPAQAFRFFLLDLIA
jgi:hypothetical protein